MAGAEETGVVAGADVATGFVEDGAGADTVEAGAVAVGAGAEPAMSP